jgi:outer membrane protein TolC
LSRWWSVFNDPALEKLVALAVESNHDLRLAGARIREAKADLGIASGALLPEVNLTGAATRIRISENATRFPDSGLYSNLYTGGFGASWEIDLFGGTRRAIEAAEADLETTVVFREAVRVSLLGELAANYVGLRGNQRLL